MFIIVIFLFFFLLQKKKVKLKKTKNLMQRNPANLTERKVSIPPGTTRRPLQVIQNFLAHCV